MRASAVVRSAAAAIAVAPLLATSRAGADAQAFAGSGVGVTAEDCPQNTAKRAGEFLAAALPRYAAELPLHLPAGEAVTVHLYGTAKAYRDAVTAAGAPALAGNLAATLDSTHECHVVLQPRADAAALDAVGGIPEMTRWLLLHEVVHQIVQRADPAARDWPDWYGEGMAEHVAKRLARAAGAPPTMVEQDKAHRVLDALETGRLPRLAQVLATRETATSDARRPVYYAAWLALYDLLASDPARLEALHARVRAWGTAGGAPRTQRGTERDFAQALEATFGPLPALEKRWEASIRAAKPEWFEGARSTQRVGDAWVCTAFPPPRPGAVDRAMAVRVAPAPGVPFRLETEWTLADLGMRQVEVYLAWRGREDPRYMKVAFRSDGSASVLCFAEDAWQERYRVGAPVDPDALACGVPHRTRVDVDAERLHVEVDGKPVIEAPVPPGYDALSGQVGLGVSDGVATFRGFQTTPLKR